MTGSAGNTFQARVGTAPEKASEEGGEDVDIGMGQAWDRVPPYGYPTDHQ